MSNNIKEGYMGLVIDGFAHVMPKAFADALMEVHPTDEGLPIH